MTRPRSPEPASENRVTGDRSRGPKTLPFGTPETVVTLGVPLHAVSMAQALDRIEWFVETRQPRYVVTPNVDFAAQASRDVELHRILCAADLVLCDGTPLAWASRWLGGGLPERVAGSDLLGPLLERATRRGYRVFFLGSSPDVLDEARRRCEARFPGLQVCGTHSPPYAAVLELDHEALRDRIRSAQPDILLVAMGPPKQEKFISMNYRELGVPCSLGVGASLDFLAGKFARAPEWMRRTGTEWLFRLVQEPRRLFRRYWNDLRFYFPTLAAQLIQNQRTTPTPAPSSPPALDEGVSWYQWRGRVDAVAVRAGAVERPRPTSASGVVLGLEAVDAIDAVGLGALVQAWKACEDEGRTLVLYRPSVAVIQAMEAARLDRVLQVATTVQEAERILARDPGVPSMESSYDAHSRTLRLSLSGLLAGGGVDECHRFLLERWPPQPDAEALEIDLEPLLSIDSAGVRWLRDVERMVRERPPGRFAVVRPRPNVLNVIEHGAPGLLAGGPPSPPYSK